MTRSKSLATLVAAAATVLVMAVNVVPAAAALVGVVSAAISGRTQGASFNQLTLAGVFTAGANACAKLDVSVSGILFTDTGGPIVGLDAIPANLDIVPRGTLFALGFISGALSGGTCTVGGTLGGGAVAGFYTRLGAAAVAVISVLYLVNTKAGNAAILATIAAIPGGCVGTPLFGKPLQCSLVVGQASGLSPLGLLL